MNLSDDENIAPEVWEKKQTTLSYNDHEYTRNKTYKDQEYYRCKHFRSGCAATLIMNTVTNMVEQKAEKRIHRCRSQVTVVNIVTDYKDAMKTHAVELVHSTRKTSRQIWKIVSEAALVSSKCWKTVPRVD